MNQRGYAVSLTKADTLNASQQNRSGRYMKKMGLVAILVMLALGTVIGQQAAGTEAGIWTDNFAAAKAQAEKEGKDLLLDFTGSDWCGWCQKLKKEVFDTPEFKAEAPKKFVLVELDFPRSRPLSEEVKAQNARLQQQYGIRGFPAIVLLDRQGRAYAQTGYRQGGQAAYLKHLGELQAGREQRDAAWAKAAQATGLEKAKLLAEGLGKMEDGVAAMYYAAEVKELAELDPQDTTGKVKDLTMKVKLNDLQTRAIAAAQAANDGAPGLKLVEEFMAAEKPEGDLKQLLMMFKLNFIAPNTPAGLEQAEKLIDEIIAINAESPIAQQAANIKGQIVEIKKRMAAEAAGESQDQVTPPDGK